MQRKAIKPTLTMHSGSRKLNVTLCPKGKGKQGVLVQSHPTHLDEASGVEERDCVFWSSNDGLELLSDASQLESEVVEFSHCLFVVNRDGGVLGSQLRKPSLQLCARLGEMCVWWW
jgi:hypothetical protein